MSAIEVEGLSLGRSLRGVSFHLPAGSCSAVIGANGAGKSTLLGLLAGALRPDTGRARCGGPVAYLPEGLGLDGLLRVEAAVALLSGLPGWEPAVGGALLERFGLDPKARIGALSMGQRTRLGVALTLGRRARTYLLDDPFLGLDPMAQVIVERAISERAAEATVLLGCQHAAAAERLCDHLLLLRAGALLWCAPVDAWRARYRRLRVSGPVDVQAALGALVVHLEPQGGGTVVLVDDPAGMAERQLRVAGARVDEQALPLDELLLWVSA
ncbi:MAG: ATP-binding cassette domain-containing protein [Deltaproteobacteria bacterium]|nr:ATP-binding cassette domain-containing protein [Deltaproteobacteria bacterium]